VVWPYGPSPELLINFWQRQTLQQDRPLVRIFSEKNINHFKNDISRIDWAPVYNSNDVNEGYSYFEDKIKTSYQKNFKIVRQSRKRAKDKTWITAGLKLSSRHKNILYKKWLKSKSSVDEERYKTYRKHYKQLIKEAKRTYYKELFDTRSNSVKQLWNNRNQIVSLSKNKRTNIINKILVNNYYVGDPKTISNHFNQYFCSVGLNLQNQFKQKDGSEFRSYLNSPIKDSMFCYAVSKDEILNIIAKFKNKKSSGPDNITP